MSGSWGSSNRMARAVAVLAVAMAALVFSGRAGAQAVVTGVSPNQGHVLGGVRVTVTGSGFNFAGGTPVVSFGGTLATSVTEIPTGYGNSDISCVIPARAAGNVAIQVTPGGGGTPGSLAGFAPIAIGLGLTLIHLISIPVTNTSVNPARSLSQAVFVQGWALEQVWLFWVAPIAGAVLAGVVYKVMAGAKS